MNVFSLLNFRYVGNLDPAVTEDLIIALFSPIGQVKSCKIISEVRLRNKCFFYIVVQLLILLCLPSTMETSYVSELFEFQIVMSCLCIMKCTNLY